jgi:Na+-transporting NADH:ubiquinone oxidoreductase subunit C
MEFSTTRTIGFATIVCFVCSIFVAASAVGLKDRQRENEVLDRQKKVLEVALSGTEEGKAFFAQISQDPAKIKEAYATRIKPELVSLKAEGNGCEGQDAATFDQQRFVKDPEKSTDVSGNKAKVQRTPHCAKVFHVRSANNPDQVEALILPVEGKGLWSTLYGYIALSPNGVDITGLTFYKHAETPGLGGEVDNPKWKAQWSGKKAFKPGSAAPALRVEKGKARDDYSVDGLFGATLTSNGVTHLLQFWLGERGFGPYIQTFVGGQR